MKIVFPSLMISLSLWSAIVYGFYGDWRHVAYWTAAAVLTASVTF